jgi:serine/threonine protein kinase
MCGSAQYVAPEVLRQAGYDQQCDLWSAGVVIYTILAGYLPFEGETSIELVQKVTTADFQFHSKFWSHVSNEAKDLIHSLLEVDPKKRFAAQQALTTSNWFDVLAEEETSLVEQDKLEATNAPPKKLKATNAPPNLTKRKHSVSHKGQKGKSTRPSLTASQSLRKLCARPSLVASQSVRKLVDKAMFRRPQREKAVKSKA